MTENNKNNGQLEDFFDDSPTDELPTLAHPGQPPEDDDTVNSLGIDCDCPTSTGIAVLEPGETADDTDTEEHQAVLTRYEAEILELRSGYEEIETTLEHRDETLRQLRAEIAQRNAAYEELECELQAIAAERASAESAAAELRQSLEQRDVDMEQVSAGAENAVRELADSRAELNELQAQINQVRTAADEHRNDAANVEQRAEELARLNAEQRAELATLTAYIDGRKADWESLHNELRLHRETITGLELSLDAAAESLTRKEEEKQALVAKIAHLEHRFTALDEHRASADREIAASRARLDKVHMEFEEQLAALQALLEQKDQTIDHLQRNLQNQLSALRTVWDRTESLGANEPSIRTPDAPPTYRIVTDEQQADRSVTCLMVATNEDRVMKYPLYKKVITIGRSHHSDIQIRTEYVSREHARILTDDLGTFIEDLGSRNGIRVNAMQVEKRRLKHGDRVNIGEVHFKFIDLRDRESGEGNA